MRNKMLALITSFIFGVSLTLYSSFFIKEDVIRVFSVKTNIGEGEILVEEIPKVEVIFSCSKISADNFTKNEVEIKIPKTPIFEIDFSKLEYPRPPLCKIKKVSPQKFIAKINRKIIKKLKVKADIVGEMEGFKYSINIIPPYVVATGPEDELKDKEIILTDIIDIFGKEKSFSTEVPLYDIGLKKTEIQPNTVKVLIDIFPSQASPPEKK